MVLHMFIGFVESHLQLMLHGMVEYEMEAKLVNELRSDGEMHEIFLTWCKVNIFY